MIKILINGMGVVGRELLKMIYVGENIKVVAINDPYITPSNLAYLLKHDSIYHDCSIETYENEESIVMNGSVIPLYAYKDDELSNLPAGEKGVDFAIDCTGRTTTSQMQDYISAGAKYVIACHPLTSEIPFVAYGVNENTVNKNVNSIVSLGSMEMQVMAKILKILNDNYTVNQAIVKNFRSYTNSQSVVDSACSEFARGRAAAFNICPVADTAYKYVGKIIPALNGFVAGSAFRAPVICGGAINITAELATDAQAIDINTTVKGYCDDDKLFYSHDTICSSDALGLDAPAFVAPCTMVTKNGDHTLANVTVMYDYVRGYARVIAKFLQWYVGKFY